MNLALPLVLALAPLGQQDDAPRDRELARALPLPELAPDSLDAWIEHVWPCEAELGAESIDWIPDFAQGMRESAQQGRPLLFWAMNGHPLGCT